MAMGRYEWIILEVLFLGLLVWELVRTRRAIRRAKKDATRVTSSAAFGTAASPAPRGP
jgi:hypothetical protein